jgi:hypothetical protein
VHVAISSVNSADDLSGQHEIVCKLIVSSLTNVYRLRTSNSRNAARLCMYVNTYSASYVLVILVRPHNDLHEGSDVMLGYCFFFMNCLTVARDSRMLVPQKATESNLRNMKKHN